jgi:hypothetical protein
MILQDLDETMSMTHARPTARRSFAVTTLISLPAPDQRCSGGRRQRPADSLQLRRGESLPIAVARGKYSHFFNDYRAQPVRPGVRLPLAGFARDLTGNGPNEKSHGALATAGRTSLRLRDIRLFEPRTARPTRSVEKSHALVMAVTANRFQTSKAA